MDGCFVVSLDFELHYGVRDHRTIAQYRENLLGVRRAIPAMLELFRRYEIHATWATVGMLFFRTRKELLGSLPTLRPAYRNPRLSPYDELDALGDDEAADPFHFGASLLQQILAAPHQEIGTHTFSHFCCLEAGQDVTAFAADLEAARRAAEPYGVQLLSLVFPRNQCNPGYLETCRRAGLVAYRGNQRSWLYAASEAAEQSRLRRGLRFLDAYLPLTALHGGRVAEIATAFPHDVSASRFLRPYSRRFRALEPLRRRRILRELTRAAERGLIYHLWWHPHNFGVHLEENLRTLEAILQHYAQLRGRYRMQSLNMAEVAARAAEYRPAAAAIA